MTTPLTLYLMIGYPGAGKTTVAQLLAEETGAAHLWTDATRKEMFPVPTHSAQESQQLYAHLNQEAGRLLASGHSVIFDTNFNFYKDRQQLRTIARRNNAQTKLLWVQVPKALAYQRATQESHGKPTRVFNNMSHADFERIASHFEPPKEDEAAIILDGTKITRQYITDKLL